MTPKYPLQLTYTGSLRNLIGGADESRTRYPLRAKQMLSQLSYSPICRRLCIISNLFKKKRVIFIKVKNIAL